ncbi:hypothetical protein C8Q72DRAFT_160648 [Fomitopsis betulina]|nr:hypothetical protein C8Q72DRAFT_160648 [Fomitopsis betulina]
MISYAFKAAWFALSLSGLLGSLVALRYSVAALGGLWIPISYAIANTTMQTVFCLGLIWKMNPYAMPSGFCRLQAALITLSWFAMTGLCAIMTVSTSLTIVRSRGKLTMADFQRTLQWRPIYLLIFGCVVVFFTIYLVVSLKTHAIEGSNGLQCDVASHVWVRLLSYAGIPLLFAIPSFVLSCLSSILLFSSQRHPGRTSPAPTGTPSHKATPRESFTAFPAPRRERPRLSTLMTKRAPPCASLAASELDTVLQTPATTVFDPPTPRAASATPSGQEQIIYLVPSRTPSDPARTSVGRAPISPVVARHSRHYHLPFSWRTASTLSLPADKEGEHDTGSLHSFLPTMTPSSTRTTPELHIHHMHLFPKLMYGQPSSSTFLAELDGDGCGCSGHREEELDVFWDGTTGEIFYDDDGGVGDDIETMSGSMRWARPSFASDETKSPELAFARASTGSAPVMYTYPTSAPPSDARANADVWRALFFQAFLAATQIIATITSLADVAARRGAPTPFGTQHVALLLFAWAPTLAFGALPWRQLVSRIQVCVS